MRVKGTEARSIASNPFRRASRRLKKASWSPGETNPKAQPFSPQSKIGVIGAALKAVSDLEVNKR
jgi:hypothetical protein